MRDGRSRVIAVKLIDVRKVGLFGKGEGEEEDEGSIAGAGAEWT